MQIHINVMVHVFKHHSWTQHIITFYVFLLAH